jgi:hypothetical protein
MEASDDAIAHRTPGRTARSTQCPWTQLPIRGANSTRCDRLAGRQHNTRGHRPLRTDPQAALGHPLGFRNGQMPCANPFANLFRVLDAILGIWLQERDPLATSPIAINGRVLRGSKDGDMPGLHLLAACVPASAVVIAQMTVDAKTNEHKTVLRLLSILSPLRGRLVTAFS